MEAIKSRQTLEENQHLGKEKSTSWFLFFTALSLSAGSSLCKTEAEGGDGMNKMKKEIVHSFTGLRYKRIVFESIHSLLKLRGKSQNIESQREGYINTTADPHTLN